LGGHLTLTMEPFRVFLGGRYRERYYRYNFYLISKGNDVTATFYGNDAHYGDNETVIFNSPWPLNMGGSARERLEKLTYCDA
jgi:hypothetical protein